MKIFNLEEVMDGKLWPRVAPLFVQIRNGISLNEPRLRVG